jgi:hypothetical protein
MSWPSIGSNLNILCNNVDKTTVIITTPMAVFYFIFVKLSGNFALSATMIWESCCFYFYNEKGEFHIA